MDAVNTLAFNAMHMGTPKNIELVPWADRIRLRRLELRKSQMDVENESNGELGQTLLSRVENGKTNPLELKFEQFGCLLKSLNWNVQEFFKQTEIEMPLAFPILFFENPKTQLVDHAAPVGFHLVEVVAASAGMPVTYPVPDSIWRKGARVYKISGDSMETPSGGLKDGDWVVVDTTQNRVQEGKVYCLEIIGNGHTIKRARKLGGKWWLTSDNSVHKSFQADEAIVIGLVYSRLTSEDVR